MNPANAKFVCGAECGIAVVGTASGGTEHWGIASANASVVTSGPSSMRSTRCFRFNTTSATAVLQHTFASAIASPGTGCARCYVYFATLPSANTNVLNLVDQSGNGLGARFYVSDNTLRADRAGLSASPGIVVTTGQWYRVDIKVVCDTTTTVDLQVNGTAATQWSGSTAAQAINSVGIGPSLTCTTDFYVDDLIAATGGSDYPIGDGTCFGLYPTADRTNSAATPTDGNFGHLYSATTDFGKGASGGTAVGAQNAESTSWQSLANPLSTTIGSNWIADLTGASTEHMVWEMANLPANASAVNGVMVVLASHSASATGNNMSAGIVDTTTGSISNTVLNVDLSETTITVPCSPHLTTPDSASWTVLFVNRQAFFFGNSTDVNPDPYLDGICMEADVLLYQPKIVMVNQAVQRATVR